MQINVYVVTMLVAGVTAAWLAISILRKPSAPGRLEFVALMLAIAVWGCAQAFEGAAVTYQAKLFSGITSYLGSQSSPVLLLLFALRYSRPGMKLPLWKLLLLWLMPAVSLLMAATNGYHHLLWPSVTLRDTWAGVSAIYAHGPWFWLEVVYGYSLVVTAILTIMRSVLDLPSIYSRNSRYLFAGMVLPLGINAVYAVAPASLSGLDLTPLAFAVTCAFIMGALFRYPLFDLKPIARNVLLDNITDITITLDDKNHIVDLNPAAERALDVSLRKAMGRSVDALSRWPALLPAIRLAGDTHLVDTITSEMGSGRFFDVSVIPLRNHYDHFLGRLIVLRDATKRQRIAETLRQRESILRALSEASFDLLSAPDLCESIPRALHRLGENLDVDCICVFEVHPHPKTALQLVTQRHHWARQGCAADLDTTGPQGVPFEEHYPRWRSQLVKGQPIRAHVRDLPDPERAPLEAQGVRSLLVVPITLHDRFWGFVDFATIRTDHTWSDAEQVVLGVAANTLGAAIEHRTLDEARLQIDRQLQDARRLESLGVMAAGIAHHYNNLMTAVIGNLDLALLDLPADSAAVASIKQASKATLATIALTRQVMAYSGKAQVAPRTVNVNDLVTQNFELFNASLEPTTKLELQLCDDVPDILADPNQILQVFLNLISNSADAIGTQTGTIVLRSGKQACTAEHLSASRLPDKPEPGSFVYFEVSDTGCGMNAETQRRLFDPFFTTKAMGHGLGMSMVSGIVQTHRGAILLNSDVDRGTTIRLLFPERNGQAPAQRPNA